MSTDTISPLRHRMIEDMNARKLCAGTQSGHIRSCKRFAAFLKRSPDTATAEDIRRFHLHLSETGMSICNRNRIMTGLRFLFRVTLRRLDLAAEIYHIREPEKIPLVMSPDETRRVLAVATSLEAGVALSLCYGCAHRCVGFATSCATNPVALRPDRSFTPTHGTRVRRKLIAATASIRPQKARTRGEIPIAPAAPPPHTSHDFVPWRFSAPAATARGQAVIPAAENLHMKRLPHCKKRLRDDLARGWGVPLLGDCIAANSRFAPTTPSRSTTSRLGAPGRPGFCNRASPAR